MSVRVCHSLTQGKKQLSKKQIQLGVVTPDNTPSTGQVEVEGYLLSVTSFAGDSFKN